MSAVAVKNINGEYLFGDIIKKGKNESVVFLWDSYDEIKVKNSELICSKVIFLSKEMIIDLLLGKVSFDEASIFLYNDIVLTEGKVSLDINQLESALKYFSTLDDKNQWIRVFLECVNYNKNYIFDMNEIDSLVVIKRMLNFAAENKIADMLSYFNDFLNRKNLPLLERYTEKEDKKFILKLAFDLDDEYEEEFNSVLYSYLNDKEFDDDLEVVYMRAYSYYGGNSFCNCDYKKAEENLLILYKNGDTFAANSLGYIYYYGRVNDGVGQYDLAYKYFSIAAFANETEAIIKVSDMFKNGYHVDKNYKVAFQMLDNIYNEQLNLLENGKNNKFADVALRIGTMCENGYYLEKDLELATKIYLLAKVAITLREKYYPHFGDSSVKKGIDKSIERINAFNFKWSKIQNKEYILNRYINCNIYYSTIKFNKKKETVIHLNNEGTNKKIIIDLNNKRTYFSDRLSLIINSKHELMLDDNKSLKIIVYYDYIFLENGDNCYYIPLKDIKIKLYDEIHIRENSFNTIND